jgi:hypothetical protein
MCWIKKNKNASKYVLVSEDTIKEPYPYVFIEENGNVRELHQRNAGFLKCQWNQQMVPNRTLKGLMHTETDMVYLAVIAFVRKYHRML